MLLLDPQIYILFINGQRIGKNVQGRRTQSCNNNFLFLWREKSFLSRIILS
ncbi:hypothetical protein PRABACTJOHN_00724 [Parabacteroides johnsonii DSM 18315]|uniref:Uncharacterized protein n=1 Tax=Parabacteroides johnsonii DSM 18315 TaxID=537006 RepID=B7B6S9_9BACT|nr:hypothetical protein PRABACTJOHN_00724 [Parabacteroides johnsonii DSM 18315]